MNKEIENMTEDELIFELGKCYSNVMALRENKDFVINRVQLKKLLDAVKFFEEAIKDGDGKIEELRLVPKEESGGCTVSFVLMSLYEKDVEKFSNVVKEAIAFSIDSTTDGRVEIGITIPNVFTPISEESLYLISK